MFLRHKIRRKDAEGDRLRPTVLGRYKHIVGPTLRARSADRQGGEVAIAVQVLNRMIRNAKPISVRRS